MDNIHPNVEVWFNSNVYFLRLLFIYIFMREKFAISLLCITSEMFSFWGEMENLNLRKL